MISSSGSDLGLQGGELLGDAEQLPAGGAGLEAGGSVEGIQAGGEVSLEAPERLPA